MLLEERAPVQDIKFRDLHSSERIEPSDTKINTILVSHKVPRRVLDQPRAAGPGSEGGWWLGELRTGFQTYVVEMRSDLW
jgi:hypothetical protein